MVDRTGAHPLAVGELPETVRGLLFTVKQYERLTIQGAVRGDRNTAVLALMTNPIVASWEAAVKIWQQLVHQEATHGTLQGIRF
jgi:6-phospho-beta-glucosidase